MSVSTSAAASSSRSHLPKALDLTDGLDALSLHPPLSASAAKRQQALQDAVHALEGLQGVDPDERRSPPEGFADPHGALLKFIEHLLSSEHADTEPHLVAVGYELEALLSIYSPSSVKLAFASRPPSFIPAHDVHVSSGTDPDGQSADLGRRGSKQWSDAVWDNALGYTPGDRIRYEVTLPVWEEGEVLEGLKKADIPEQAPMMRVLVSLPPTYPDISPPQLQLLGRYLGSFSIDSGLFGDITRTYISSNAVPFTPGDVCVFEGLTHVQTLVRRWYISHLAEGAEGERAREEERKARRNGENAPDTDGEDASVNLARPSPSRATFSYSVRPDGLSAAEIEKFEIHTSEPIIDRRSTFVGHAIRVNDERQVPLVIHELLGDKKIAKAAHPAIFAYRIAKEVGGAAGKVYNTDYDDDGESQAGARLKHLLEILELENVLVVVSRWYGGTLLGPDRFKHINQAARDALELGGFLDDKKDEKKRRK